MEGDATDVDLQRVASLLLGFRLPDDCVPGVAVGLADLADHAARVRAFDPGEAGP